jgi:hypothetical protein
MTDDAAGRCLRYEPRLFSGRSGGRARDRGGECLHRHLRRHALRHGILRRAFRGCGDAEGEGVGDSNDCRGDDTRGSDSSVWAVQGASLAGQRKELRDSRHCRTRRSHRFGGVATRTTLADLIEYSGPTASKSDD